MAEHSFICNGCVCFNPKTDEELDVAKCNICNGEGSEWQPRNEEFYNKDPQKYMEHLLLGSIGTDPEYFERELADEANVQRATDILEKIGIQVKTKYGNYRPTYDVLKDIGERWEQLKV